MTLTAACHCGSTKITLPGPPTEAKTCNCSYCQRTGAVWGYYAPEDLSVTAKEDRVYSASGLNQHHFCGACGGNTHGFSPDWASKYSSDGTLKPGEAEGVPERKVAAVNLNMIDNLELSGLTVQAMDGRNSW
ncbi:MAG TPA: GFA family protein [Brevundimonas sp.]|jgi:hypothetical protein